MTFQLPQRLQWNLWRTQKKNAVATSNCVIRTPTDWSATAKFWKLFGRRDRGWLYYAKFIAGAFTSSNTWAKTIQILIRMWFEKFCELFHLHQNHRMPQNVTLRFQIHHVQLLQVHIQAQYYVSLDVDSCGVSTVAQEEHSQNHGIATRTTYVGTN